MPSSGARSRPVKLIGFAGFTFSLQRVFFFFFSFFSQIGLPFTSSERVRVKVSELTRSRERERNPCLSLSLCLCDCACVSFTIVLLDVTWSVASPAELNGLRWCSHLAVERGEMTSKKCEGWTKSTRGEESRVDKRREEKRRGATFNMDWGWRKQNESQDALEARESDQWNNRAHCSRNDAHDDQKHAMIGGAASHTFMTNERRHKESASYKRDRERERERQRVVRRLTQSYELYYPSDGSFASSGVLPAMRTFTLLRFLCISVHPTHCVTDVTCVLLIQRVRRKRERRRKRK